MASRGQAASSLARAASRLLALPALQSEGRAGAQGAVRAAKGAPGGCAADPSSPFIFAQHARLDGPGFGRSDGVQAQFAGEANLSLKDHGPPGFPPLCFAALNLSTPFAPACSLGPGLLKQPIPLNFPNHLKFDQSISNVDRSGWGLSKEPDMRPELTWQPDWAPLGDRDGMERGRDTNDGDADVMGEGGNVAGPNSGMQCGRGDKRTKRGKRFKGSFGNARPSKKKLNRRIREKWEYPGPLEGHPLVPHAITPKQPKLADT